MKRYVLALSAAAVFSLVLASGVPAAQVKSADLAGKKICWDGGSVSSYNAGGKYSNDLTGDGTWSVATDGIHIHTDRYDYVATLQKMPDGTFHAEIAAVNLKVTGKYCK